MNKPRKNKVNKEVKSMQKTVAAFPKMKQQKKKSMYNNQVEKERMINIHLIMNTSPRAYPLQD